ncbi:hypothetical protein BG000_004734 [Podila horticola]|nr:hypothetical protein BG000_004734 [Podila horticola]
MLFQIPTLAWALALALVIIMSSASASSGSRSGDGSRSSTETDTTTGTTTGTTTIPHNKINALIAQAIVSALLSDMYSSASKSNNAMIKGKTILVPPPSVLHPSRALTGLPSRIEIELDKVEIGGVALPELSALRVNVKSAAANYGNVKISTQEGGSN